MATVKVKFRASTIPTKEGTVFYQVIHNRVVRQVNPGYKLYPHEWDTANAEIVFPPGIESGRRNYLFSLKSALAEDVRRFKGIITRFERAARNYTAEEVAERFLVSADSGGFMSFGRELVRQLKQICKMPTAERYTTVLNSFERFLGEKDVPLDEVDSHLMVEYEIFLHANDACPNTSSYYMRGLRAIYNRAVEKELTIQRSPFKHVYTGIDKTVKRAVPLKIIRQIRKLDLTLFPAMDFARDIFMFSFYTRGMSFVDMAYLKKKDLQNGILSYRRQKTGQLLFIKWERPMQEIIDKYDTGGSPYLLPIIKNMNANERWQYKNAAHLVNSKLKRLGEKLGLAMPLTSYVARHAWASIAKSKNVPLATISEAMGHNSEKTTQIYLASLDTSAVDKANSQILKSL
ncbi:site-specific integrase [uncultured Sanguibacteroides sp.]|uniref:site-specific integrase n=1 Tax=uncultured Sanguibacteroides sp. TaxID=1635151 RepID=UPI0025EA57D6|nr:site-specific integrase [uncultured Sanguibacteroides sp.]